MKPLLVLSSVLLLALGPTACVTINIYFPAAAAEKVADKIIDEVWQAQNGARPGVAPASPAKENP